MRFWLRFGLIVLLAKGAEGLPDAVRVTARQSFGECRRVARLTSGQAGRRLFLGPKRTAHPVGGVAG
jgi:hypothetical protein